MNRRWLALTGALVVALTAPQSMAVAAPSSPTAPTARVDDRAGTGNGLARLRADANGRLRVHRAEDGAVDFVSSTDGRAMLDPRGTDSVRRTVTDQLRRYGAAFGLDDAVSRAVVTQVTDSSTGGSVVRAEQVVDGVPVFGGQVVTSLDRDGGVVSLDAATTPAVQVPGPQVSVSRAWSVALAATAKTRHVPARTLTVTVHGRRLYDPTLVHTVDPAGVRPVWELEVADGREVRETVLVGTGRGEVALHVDGTAHLNRTICDNKGAETLASWREIPVCPVSKQARNEKSAASSVLDVNQAFENLGATSAAYSGLDGIDLTDRLGLTVSGVKSLVSTVRWCWSDEDECPMANAFWDGRQMVFGEGYAAADDVVGHELTHGYVSKTSDLFYIHESGALNESLADTIGEIVDHRHAGAADDDSAWTLGEDLGDPDAMRSLKDPTLYDQPDKMTSGLFDPSGVDDDDGGAVHLNDGVGNKTAYLVSQGGTFNGRIMTGIDGSDAGLAKTGRLYLETIPRLTSGAEYADLGRVLPATCDELAGSGTGGFTVADCDQVRLAVAATELSSPPIDPSAAAAEVPVQCPTGSDENTLMARDDDDIDNLGLSSTSVLWGHAPGLAPAYATSGKESVFGYDPDPELDGVSSGSVSSAPFTVPTTSGGTRLNFHHAYVMDWAGPETDPEAEPEPDPGTDPPADPDAGSTYYDGGEVVVSKLVDGRWTRVDGLPWQNGPDRHIEGSTRTGFTGFGGDSHGYGSSEVDLSSLAGQRVKVDFRVEGDRDTSFYGWWIDDVRLYACDTAPLPPAPTVAPTAPTSPAVSAATTSATVSWRPPADQGSTPVASYRVSRSDGKVTSVAGTSRSAKLVRFDATHTQTVTVEAVNQDGLVGPAVTLRIYPTATRITSSTTKVARNKRFTVTGKVLRRGTSTLVRSMPVVLQRKVSGQRSWHTVASGRTGSRGTRSWSVRLTQRTAYRVVAHGLTGNFGSTSATRTVRKR